MMKEVYGEYNIQYNEYCEKFIAEDKDGVEITRSSSLKDLKKRLDTIDKVKKSFDHIPIFALSPDSFRADKRVEYGKVTSVDTEGYEGTDFNIRRYTDGWVSWVGKDGKTIQRNKFHIYDGVHTNFKLDTPANREKLNRWLELEKQKQALRDQQTEIAKSMDYFKLEDILPKKKEVKGDAEKEKEQTK